MVECEAFIVKGLEKEPVTEEPVPEEPVTEEPVEKEILEDPADSQEELEIRELFSDTLKSLE